LDNTSGTVHHGSWPPINWLWLIQVPTHGAVTSAATRLPGPAARGTVAITGSGPSSHAAGLYEVGDGVGRGGAGVERDRAFKRAVEVGLNAEVEVGLRAGDGIISIMRSLCR